VSKPTTAEIEALWIQLDAIEADIAKFKQAGIDGVPGFPDAFAHAERLRAQIKEIQRMARRAMPIEQYRTDKHQLRQEDAQWIEDGGWSGKR
jgi:hypothetical protein